MFGIPEWALGLGLIIIVSSFFRGRRWSGSPMDGLGGKRSRQELAQTLEDLERRLAEVEETQRQGGGGGADADRRLGELEERVDFTERLLAKQRDGERLAPPQP